MRVFVGRPRDRGAATERDLAARGHEALLAPLFTIRALPPPDLDRPPDALVLTSAQAAPAAGALLSRFGACPCFAVGRRTARALAEAGFSDVRVAGGDAAALSRLIRATMPPEARLLHLAGRERRPEPEASLRAQGYALAVAEVYESAACEFLPEALRRALAAQRLDAALHYSARAASVFVALAERAGLGPTLAGLRHLCLSGTVAEALGPGLSGRAEIASAPDEASLLALLGPAEPLAPHSPPVL